MRSSMDDVLILDLGDFSLSNYTALRKAAQRAIERVVSVCFRISARMPKGLTWCLVLRWHTIPSVSQNVRTA